MIEKKGWLKDAEARVNGFFINGKKVKGCSLTQAEVDAWNGVAKKAAPAPKAAPVVEAVVEAAEIVEETVEEVVEEATETATKSKKKGKVTLAGIAKAAIGK